MKPEHKQIIQELRDFQNEVERSKYYWSFSIAGASILAVFVLCWFIFSAPYLLLFIILFFVSALINLKIGLQQLDEFEKRKEAQVHHHL